MKRIKGIIFGLVIGIPLGSWFGYNMALERPVFSNPFKTADIKETIKKTSGDLMEKSGEVLEKSGQALQKKAQEAEPAPMIQRYQPPPPPPAYQTQPPQEYRPPLPPQEPAPH